jgi:hypothetical protein
VLFESRSQDVDMRLDVFRVNHVAATNPITMMSQVIGLKSASSRPSSRTAAIALNPVAAPVPKLAVLRMIEKTDTMTNPANEKSIPRPITLAARMCDS